MPTPATVPIGTRSRTLTAATTGRINMYKLGQAGMLAIDWDSGQDTIASWDVPWDTRANTIH